MCSFPFPFPLCHIRIPLLHNTRPGGTHSHHTSRARSPPAPHTHRIGGVFNHPDGTHSHHNPHNAFLPVSDPPVVLSAVTLPSSLPTYACTCILGFQSATIPTDLSRESKDKAAALVTKHPARYNMILPRSAPPIMLTRAFPSLHHARMRIGGVFSLPDGSDCVLASVSATIPADLSRESKDKAAALGLELANIMRAQGCLLYTSPSPRD